MLSILSFFKTYKKLSGIIGVVILLSGLLVGWNITKDKYREEGYQQAKNEYTEILVQELDRATLEYSNKLKAMRETIKAQAIREQQRVEDNVQIDKEVVTVTEYIEREVYVKEECNIVDPTLIRMFNNSINKVNTSKPD